jgi:glycosyltransferase involved in cell wall biosynthesis
MSGPKSNGRNILLLSGLRVFPIYTGGHVRTSGIARALARLGFRVRVYSLAGRSQDYGIRTLLGRSYRIDEIEPNLTEETHLGTFFGLLQSGARRLDYPRYFQNLVLRRGLIPRRLKTALSEADIVICDSPWCPPVPGPWSEKPWFMLSHNLEYRLLEQSESKQKNFATWMQEMEVKAPSEFRDIFACAEEDRDFFRSHDPGKNLRLPIIRCGVDPAAYKVSEGTRAKVRAELGISDSGRLIVFSGSRYAPNVEALEMLKKFCLKEREFLMREQVSILILGTIVETPFREGAMIATGRVPEVAPYFAASDAGLNAVTRGSGANVKIFEYLAAQLPVISTPFGARGTALEAGRDFISFEPDTLKGAIEHFIRDRSVESWKTHAGEVWLRHRATCDIQVLVQEAIKLEPAFN